MRRTWCERNGSMWWMFWIVLIVVGTGCSRPNYQVTYAGDIPIRIENQGPDKVKIYLYPTGAGNVGQQWGSGIAPGATEIFKVKNGRYDMQIENDSFLDKKTALRERLDLRGPVDIVVSDRKVPVPRNVMLVVIQGYKNCDAFQTEYERRKCNEE